MSEKQKHFASLYMIYGCNTCKQGFVMWLEQGLEEKDNKNRKPVPFFIECPFCGKTGGKAYDIAFKGFEAPEGVHEIGNEPYFANIEGEECGKPMQMEFAKVQYTKE